MFTVDLEARDSYKRYVRAVLLDKDELWRLGGNGVSEAISSLRERPARELIRFYDYISSKMQERVARADYERAALLKRVLINFNVDILHEKPKKDDTYYLRKNYRT